MTSDVPSTGNGPWPDWPVGQALPHPGQLAQSHLRSVRAAPALGTLCSSRRVPLPSSVSSGSRSWPESPETRRGRPCWFSATLGTLCAGAEPLRASPAGPGVHCGQELWGPSTAQLQSNSDCEAGFSSGHSPFLTHVLCGRLSQEVGPQPTVLNFLPGLPLLPSTQLGKKHPVSFPASKRVYLSLFLNKKQLGAAPL